MNDGKERIEKPFTITILGLGFVGLTTALGLAEVGHRIYGVDVNLERLAQIRSGQLPFAEPGLGEALERHLANGRFHVTDDAQAVARESELIFLCVGTPCGEDGAANLRYICQAIDDTLPALADGRFRAYVVKSTVPPGTTKGVIAPYIKQHKKPGTSIGLANNPEFLREGHCWQDFMQADRIVCGCEDEETAAMLRQLYAPFEAPFHVVTLNTGEYIKYLSNTLLATMISFANEMALIGEAFGDIEVAQAFRILHQDHRWADGTMKSYVYPGCGYGGYCLPKDTKALQAQAKTYGAETAILDQVIGLNEQMAEKTAKRIMRQCNKEQSLGILGLSFKPGSDDVRDTPAAKVLMILQKAGYRKIYGYDPLANEVFRRVYPELEISYCQSTQEICSKADVLTIMTAWPEFQSLGKLAGDKTIIDCRYMLET